MRRNKVNIEIAQDWLLENSELSRLICNTDFTFSYSPRLEEGKKRVDKLVNPLLDINQIESNSMDKLLESTDLRKIKTVFASGDNSAFEKAGLNDIVKYNPIEEKIYVNKEIWVNIFSNLLANASKYSLQEDRRHKDAFIHETRSLNDSSYPSHPQQTEFSFPKKMGRIVLAEDNSEMRSYISNLLSNQYDVFSFDNGKSALDEIIRQPPDLILSDVMMPVMDGLELVKHVRDDKKIADIPIVLLSSRAGQESTIMGIDTGADDYLVKPFSALELLARVKQHLNTSRVRKEMIHLKDKFLAYISHELRNPLTAIIGFVTLIHAGKAGPITKEQDECLGYVLTSSEHLLHLINSILDLAKIEAGKMEFIPEKIDLKKLTEEVTGTLKSLILEKNIKINIVIAGMMHTVSLDKGRFRQVLYNYISNAIKFTPSHGQITIRFLMENNMLRLEVEDNGIGIKAEKMGQLFQEFQQLHSSSSLQYSGTGLGLAFTKRIVEAQGGKVEVKSCFGKGSIFSAIYPLSPVEEKNDDTVTSLKSEALINSDNVSRVPLQFSL